MTDASGLTDHQMQAIAREMSNSETAFVFPPQPDGSLPVRFFTPQQEVPVCGHATLATHFVRSLETGAPEGSVVQASPGGRWEITWESRQGACHVTMRQRPVVLGEEFGDAAPFAEALGIGVDALIPGWPIQVASTGSPKAVVPIADAATLWDLMPDMAAVLSLTEEIDVGGLFVFTPETGDPAFLTACRMFGPAVGVGEDPVNGSGHGPLAAYLWARSALPAGTPPRFRSRMGVAVDRPGTVEVSVVMHDGEPMAVDVGGTAVLLFSTEFSL